MYSEESKSSNLAKFLSDYDYVFVDTCSLMEDSFPIFMDTLAASKEYWKEGLRVIVIGECVQELEKHSKNKDKEAQEARIEAKRALKILHHDKWHGKTLEITKPTTTVGFADNALFTQVSSLRIQNKILIITQDKTLATDLKKLNALDSQHGRYLKVDRLNQSGDLEENPGETGNYYHKENVRPSASNADTTSKNTTNPRPRGIFHRAEKVSSPAPDKPQAEPRHYEDRPRQDHGRRPYGDRHDSYARHDSYEKPAEVETPISEADRHLCSNLLNPKYPKEKKIADINAQLNLLGVLSSEQLNKLSLANTVEQLKAELAKLGGTFVKAAPAIKADAAMKPAETAKPAEAHAAKASEAPTNKPASYEGDKPHYWFEFGRTPEEAIAAAGSHEGLMFRDPSIPFFKGVHGPVDLTTKDLAATVAALPVLAVGESKELPLGGLTVHVEKTERDYKAYFIKPEAPKPAAAVKPAEAKVEAKKAEPAKVAPKEEPKKPAVRHTRAKAPAAKKEVAAPAEAPATATSNNIAVPPGATLIVGVPNDNTKAYIERKSRREDGQSLSIVKKDGSKAPDQKSPQNGARSPRRSPAAAKKQPAPASKSVPQKAKKPAQQTKPSKPASKPVHHDLSKVIAADKALNANINNPNYPLDNKIKALKAQAEALRPLSQEEQKKLFFNSSKIDAKLAELSKK